jgi:hypothetical protein
MTHTPRPRKALSDLTHRQLNMYALAASAAGVGVLASPLPAEAKIVYTPAHIVVQQYETYRLDINHNGVTDLSIKVNVFSNTSGVEDVVSAVPAGKNEIEGTARFRFYGAALFKGARIGPNKKFGGQTHGAILAFVGETLNGSIQYGGNWVNVNHRYLGVKFHIKGKTHYGWVRANVFTVRGPVAGVILTGWAYETIPNKAIIAGATRGADDADPTAFLNPATPEPPTLGMLALGAPGLAIWRREESALPALGPNKSS